MSRQGLTLLGLGGGLKPITPIRLVLCMKTPLDRTQQPITARRCYQHTIQTHCCQFSKRSNISRHHNPLIRHSNLRKRTVHIQTVQWRLHNHNRLRHRRLATHLSHHQQVRITAQSLNHFFSSAVSLYNFTWNVDNSKKSLVVSSQGPLHIPAIPAAKRTGYEDASLLRQPWSYEPPFDYNYAPGYPYSIERDRKVFYPSYPDQYAQVSSLLSITTLKT